MTLQFLSKLPDYQSRLAESAIWLPKILSGFAVLQESMYF